MSRDSQQRLTEVALAGDRCVLIGPMPENDEEEKPCVIKVTASIAPRGVLILVVVNEALQGLLLNRGMLEPTNAFSPFIVAAGEEIPPGRDLVGRRTSSGWQFASRQDRNHHRPEENTRGTHR
jgi:hypothetical protein